MKWEGQVRSLSAHIYRPFLPFNSDLTMSGHLDPSPQPKFDKDVFVPRHFEIQTLSRRKSFKYLCDIWHVSAKKIVCDVYQIFDIW